MVQIGSWKLDKRVASATAHVSVLPSMAAAWVEWVSGAAGVQNANENVTSWPFQTVLRQHLTVCLSALMVRSCLDGKQVGRKRMHKQDDCHARKVKNRMGIAIGLHGRGRWLLWWAIMKAQACF